MSSDTLSEEIHPARRVILDWIAESRMKPVVYEDLTGALEWLNKNTKDDLDRAMSELRYLLTHELEGRLQTNNAELLAAVAKVDKRVFFFQYLFWLAVGTYWLKWFF